MFIVIREAVKHSNASVSIYLKPAHCNAPITSICLERVDILSLLHLHPTDLSNLTGVIRLLYKLYFGYSGCSGVVSVRLLLIQNKYYITVHEMRKYCGGADICSLRRRIKFWRMGQIVCYFGKPYIPYNKNGVNIQHCGFK